MTSRPAEMFLYKRGQSGAIRNWKKRYFEYDAASKTITYRDFRGGTVKGSFVVCGVRDHADTGGHSMVFEILRADGRPPLLCAGVEKKSSSDRFPEAKAAMTGLIEASLASELATAAAGAESVELGDIEEAIDTTSRRSSGR